MPLLGECHSNSDQSTLHDIAVGLRWNTLQLIVLGIALLEPAAYDRSDTLCAVKVSRTNIDTVPRASHSGL